MLWAILAFLSAISNSTGDVFLKKLTKKIDIYTLFFSLVVLWTPVFIILYIFNEKAKITPLFTIITIASAILVFLGNILFMLAIKTGPLSLSMPFFALTPFFAAIISYFLNKEVPSLYGCIGIFLVVLGCYAINIKDIKKGFFKPWLKIFHNKGSWYAFLAALLFSISQTFDKFNINMSNTFFYFSYKWFFLLAIFGIILLKTKLNVKGLKKNIKSVFTTGILKVGGELLYMIALGMSFVAYASAIKRSSVLFSVLYGHFIFKEKDIKQRLIGAIIIIIGLILIVFAS